MKRLSTILAFCIAGAATAALAQDHTHDDILQRLETLESFHDVNPPPDPDPDPPAGNVPAAIANMAAGTWLEYGHPWEATAPYSLLDCGNGDSTQFKSVLSAWNGWARDGLDYAWVVASGGHGDGCDNGVYRYNIQTGELETVVLHVLLNDFSIPGKPFVADGNGVQILPRSSHTYNGTVLDGDWIYLAVGSEYGDGKFSTQVWRFHTINHVWERLPDTNDSRKKAHLIKTPTGVLIASDSSLCDVDLVSGTYTNCTTDVAFPTKSTPAWDVDRDGLWVVNRKDDTLDFYHRHSGTWVLDSSAPFSPDGLADIGNGAGVCVVPDGSVLIWGLSNQLHKWDGSVWETIIPTGGPLDKPKRRAQTKFSWDDDAQACVGADYVEHGLWVYKPVLSGSSGAEPVQPPATQTGMIHNLPDVGGLPVSVAPFTLAAWNEPVTRRADSPDYDAICGSEWSEVHIRSEADITDPLPHTGATRVYMHPLPDGQAYTSRLRANGGCLEVIGVGDELVELNANVKLDRGKGLIIRNMRIVKAGNDCPVATANKNLHIQPHFITLHGNEFFGCWGHVHFFGSSDWDANHLHIEMIGNVSGHAGQSHTFYNERSVGTFVYVSNVCFAPGWGHCMKNLAHEAIFEGNVLSNAGLDGLPILAEDSYVNKDRFGGQHVFDLYGCTLTTVRNNTIIFRTTNSTQNFIAYRSRGAWGGCPKETPEFFDHYVEGNRFIGIPSFDGNFSLTLARLSTLRPTDRFDIRSGLNEESKALATACAGNTACYLAGASPELLYVYNHVSNDWKTDIVANGKLPQDVPIQPEGDWTERYGVHWDTSQEAYLCQPDGTDCQPWDAPPPLVKQYPWDALAASNPPQLWLN